MTLLRAGLIVIAVSMSIGIVLAATYPVSIPLTISYYASWSGMLAPRVFYQLGINYWASWLLKQMPSALRQLGINYWVTWSIYPTPRTSRLLQVLLSSNWLGVVSTSLPDYLGNTRLIEFMYTGPILSFNGLMGKKVIDGALYVTSTDHVKFFYGYTGPIIVVGGNATFTGNGYIITSQGGKVSVHDLARCIISVTDPVGWPYAGVRVYMDGTEVQQDSWFDCTSGAIHQFTVEGGKIAYIKVNDKIFRTIEGDVTLLNSTMYRINVAIKLPALLVINNITATRLPDGRVQLTFDGTLSDIRYAKPIKDAIVYVRVENTPSGAFVTDENGRFYGSIVTPFFVSPYINQLGVKLSVTHPDYEEITMSESVSLPSARAALYIPTEVLIGLVVAIGIVAAIIGVIAVRKRRLAVFKPYRRVLRDS